MSDFAASAAHAADPSPANFASAASTCSRSTRFGTQSIDEGYDRSVARFERDGRFIELWLVDGDPWPSLWRREGDIDGDASDPVEVRLAHRFSGERTLREQAN